MIETLFVKSGPTAAPGRVILWERHGAHPEGEIWIADGGMAQVALTPEVAARLKNGTLERATETEFSAFQAERAKRAEEGAIELARREEEALAAEMAQAEARFSQIRAENEARRQELAAQVGGKR